MAAEVGWIGTDARLIIAARAVRGFAQSAVGVLLAIYLGVQGFSLFETGLLLTCGSAGASAIAVLTGLFGDALGRRRTLFVLSAIMTATGVAFATSETFAVLLTVAFVGSFSALAGSGGGMGTIEQAVLPTCVPDERRTDVFAVYSTIGMLAASFGALAAGFPTMLQREAGIAALASMRVMFLGYACFGVVLATMYGGLSTRIEDARGRTRWTNPLRLPSRRRISTLAGLFAVDSFGTGLVVESLTSYWFFTKFGLEPAELGALFFGSNALAAASLWVAARLARRIGLLNTMVFTHIPSSLFLVAMVFAPVAWVAVTFWLLRAFLSQMDVPTSQSYTMAVVRPEERTAMVSATMVARSAGVALGPTITAALWTASSATVPFVAGALVKISYDLALWRVFRTVKPPEESLARSSASSSGH
jgi:MFS family permease